MNILLIVTGFIFLACVIVGYVRGFVRIVASLAATLVIMIVVMFASPYVSKVILKTVPLEATMQKKCVELLTGQDAEQIELDKEPTREQQISLIEGAKVPEIFKDLLLENNNSEIYESLGVTYFFEYVGSYIAKLIADMLAFLLTFIVVTIIVRAILYVLGIISDLPLIGGLNRVAGAGLGLGIGLIIVWVMFVAVTLLYSTEIGARCLKDIADSPILTFLYNKNVLMNFITKFR